MVIRRRAKGCTWYLPSYRQELHSRLQGVNLLHVQHSNMFVFILGCEGTIMTISKDRVKPSPLPDSWKLPEIFATGVVIGTYLAIMTVMFYWAAAKTMFFQVYRSILLPH